MKTVSYTFAARKQFRKLSPQVAAQIEAKLVRYAATGAGDVTELKGEEGLRLRSGDYRAIFVETETSLEVRAVGHRRDIYR